MWSGWLPSRSGLLGITFGLIESSSHPWASFEVVGPLLVGAALVGFFVLWEGRTSSPMLPPSLLRARSFASGCGVYLLTYLALAGVMFYVTLLFQDVEGWSPLRTGLSWLSMNIPFIVAAQFAGRLRRRFQPVVIVVSGCLVGAVGVAVLAQLSDTTSFGVAFVGLRAVGGGLGHAGTRGRKRRHARRAPWRLRWRVRPRQCGPPSRDFSGTGCPRGHRGPCRHERMGQPQRRGVGRGAASSVRRRGSDRSGDPSSRFAVSGRRGVRVRLGVSPGAHGGRRCDAPGRRSGGGGVACGRWDQCRCCQPDAR